MYRRDFLKIGASAAAAAPAALSSYQHASAAPRFTIRKAVKLGMVDEDLSIEEKFKLLLELGFDGVELSSPNDLDRDEVLAAQQASGIPIHGIVDSVHWNMPFSDPDPAVREAGMQGLVTALDDARAYGASTVLLVPAVVRKDIAYQDAYRRSQEEIREVLPMAEEYGVKIAIENVWNMFLLSPVEAARYIDEFESDAIGWYFDVGNIVNYGWPEHWIRTLGDRILKLDIKEYSRKLRDESGPWAGFNVPLGEGDCDWPAVVEALDDIGYTGWATAEVSGGDRIRLADLAARMDRILPTVTD